MSFYPYNAPLYDRAETEQDIAVLQKHKKWRKFTGRKLRAAYTRLTSLVRAKSLFTTTQTIPHVTPPHGPSVRRNGS